MKTKKTILIAPLDWGLGHASRCIPIIKHYINEGQHVILAAYGQSQKFLEISFPDLKYIRLPGMQINYSTGKSQLFTLLRQTPKLLKAIKAEKIALEKLIESESIDMVISDNRFGLYSKKAHCIFITHQLFIPSPYFKNWVNKKNHSYISQFDECWVPDEAGENNLSGTLSHGEHPLTNVKYISPLSRFEKACENKTNYTYDYCIILSGPREQKDKLEALLTKQLSDHNLKCAIVNSNAKTSASKTIQLFPMLGTQELYELVNDSKKIITRSGYSSIMDLAILQKPAILIPTPGQYEQEYLANYHQSRFTILHQHQISKFDFNRS